MPMGPEHQGYSIGPEGEDWRVPVHELESRLQKLRSSLDSNGVGFALIQTPVDLYYFTGSRQNGTWLYHRIRTYKPSTSFDAPTVGQSGECGGNDSPVLIEKFPRMREFSAILAKRGCSGEVGIQFGELPHTFANLFVKNLTEFENFVDITNLVHGIREVKSEWEVNMMQEVASIQRDMFDAILRAGKEGLTELDLVAQSDKVSRENGFGGIVQMRRYPMMCNRGVVLAGKIRGSHIILRFCSRWLWATSTGWFWRRFRKGQTKRACTC